MVRQRGLTEREIQELLRGRPAVALGRPPPRANPADAAALALADAGVARRELEADELCPICYDSMASPNGGGGEVTYCRRSCGKNVHTKCMKMWADNRVATGEAVTCPLCRGDWGVPDWLRAGPGYSGHALVGQVRGVLTPSLPSVRGC